MNDYAVVSNELGKKYGDKWGLTNATFTVKKGELAVIVGPNGAGKTTTIKILTTILRPSKGNAEVLDMNILKDHKEIRKRIAYLPQGFEINRNLTPLESIKWNLVLRGFSLSDAKLQAKKWIELMNLWSCRNRTGWTLSGGQRRKVTVAMVLATEADVVFLDEPSVGLDVEARHITWRVIRKTVEMGVTIILTTHNMKEAETIADVAILINKGETVIEDEPQRLINSLPNRYRVIVRKNCLTDTSSSQAIDLGDRIILYVKSYRKVKRILSNLNDLTGVISVEKVGLEDAYLHFIYKGGNRDA
jgi:ABC-2 type transport system ATP-binding protein